MTVIYDHSLTIVIYCNDTTFLRVIQTVGEFRAHAYVHVHIYPQTHIIQITNVDRNAVYFLKQCSLHT